MAARTLYDVVAQVRQGERWTSVCATYDPLYARAMYQEFKDAGVPARIDTFPNKRGAARKNEVLK